MDRSNDSGAQGGRGNQRPSEDTTEATEHVENAAENRDALAAQARRTEATTPESIQTTDEDAARRTEHHASGAAPTPTESTARAAEHTENAAENRDALAAQARRTQATTPDKINLTGPPRDND